VSDPVVSPPVGPREWCVVSGARRRYRRPRPCVLPIYRMGDGRHFPV